MSSATKQVPTGIIRPQVEPERGSQRIAATDAAQERQRERPRRHGGRAAALPNQLAIRPSIAKQARKTAGLMPALRKQTERPPLDEYFNSLFTALGPQHWWPGNTPFEVIIGAILTQNTSWKNVEQAISNLREADLLSAGGIQKANLRRLERLVRPSGYFRQKARKLKAFCKFLE